MTEETFNKYKLVIDEWFVNGFNGTKAYQKFYPKATYNTADKGFRDIHGNPRIQEYVKEKQTDTSNKLQITLDNQLIELNDIKAKAKKDDKYSDAINAIKEQNKLLGLYGEHNNQKKTEINIPITEWVKSIK